MMRSSSVAVVRRMLQEDASTLLLNSRKVFVPVSAATQICEKHTVPSRKVSGVAVAVEDFADADISSTSSSVLPFEDIPTPIKAKGFVGSVLSIHHAYKKNAFKRPHMYAMQNHDEFGPIYRTELGDGTPFVSLSDPKDIEMVYHNSGKYPERIQIEAWKEHRDKNGRPYGVLIEDGAKWQSIRSALSHRILRPPEIAQFVGCMNDVARDFVDKLAVIKEGPQAGQREGMVVKLEEELNKWAMESSCKFFFDRRLGLMEGELKQENLDFFQAIHNLTEMTIYLLMFPLKWHRTFKTKPYVATWKAWDTLYSLSKKYVDSKLNELAVKAIKKQQVDDGSFLGFLMVQDKLTPEQIYGNMTELLTASIDTTSTTALWCLHLLSNNPDVQQTLYEEVMRVIPSDVDPTREQIDSMPYLKAVIKETLRMFPVTQGTARVLPKDTTIRNYNLPAGTAVQTFFFASGNDPKIWGDASEFRPERWLKGSKKISAFASQPFGFGSRMCLGRRLAEQELYLVISQISRRFVVEATKDEISHVCKVLITPDRPLELKFIDRN